MVSITKKKKNEIIRELKERAGGLSSGSIEISSSVIEKDEILRLKQIIQDKERLILQLKSRIKSGEEDLESISSIGKALDDDSSSKYISL